MSSVRSLCELCRAERRSWRAAGDKQSPGCAGIFRSWFAGDEEAWVCVSAIFEPLLTSWVSAWITKLGKQTALTAEDVPDLVSEVLHVRMVGYARRYPQRAAGLVDGADIAKVLGFVKTTTQNCVLEKHRQRGRFREAPLLERAESDQEEEDARPAAGAPPPTPDFAGAVVDKLLAAEAQRRCLRTEAEQVAAYEILQGKAKSNMVLELYPHLFGEIGDVYETTRRVKNCLRRTLLELLGEKAPEL
jgi:DNA-directed RNA polymerase specialized sigma24 family protein